MIRVAIAGAAGKMGCRLIALACERDDLLVVSALECAGHTAIGSDAGEVAGVGSIDVTIGETDGADFDVLIDFSTPAGTDQWLAYCLDNGKPIVIGTTGHSPDQLADIEKAAGAIAVLKAANMSVGMNLMFKLAAQMATVLGEDYDIEIVESHHRFKVDAPSGSALALRDSIVEATGRDSETDVIYGRRGHSGQRPRAEIGVHALRLGDTVGEHEVHFGTLGETLILKHSAHTRDTFASGALRAAVWLSGKPPGTYDMQDVLGL